MLLLLMLIFDIILNHFASHDYWQPRGLAGTDDSAQVSNFTFYHMAIEEQQSRKRLVLCGKADFLFYSKVIQKGVDFRFPLFAWVPNIMEVDEPFVSW